MPASISLLSMLHLKTSKVCTHVVVIENSMILWEQLPEEYVHVHGQNDLETATLSHTYVLHFHTPQLPSSCIKFPSHPLSLEPSLPPWHYVDLLMSLAMHAGDKLPVPSLHHIRTYAQRRIL